MKTHKTTEIHERHSSMKPMKRNPWNCETLETMTLMKTRNQWKGMKPMTLRNPPNHETHKTTNPIPQTFIKPRNSWNHESYETTKPIKTWNPWNHETWNGGRMIKVVFISGLFCWAYVLSRSVTELSFCITFMIFWGFFGFVIFFLHNSCN